ncbi:MAG: hypothetical protein WAW75_00615 [Gallionella sp.]|jgi:hypothetical protein
MATKPRTTAKTSLEITLDATRLKKLAVEVLIPPEKSVKGTLNISFKVSLFHTLDESRLVILLGIDGSGLSGDEGKVAFTVDAAIEGLCTLSRKPKEGELVGREPYLADYLVPILSDMIETVLTKSGYLGVSLPRSFPNKPVIGTPK